MKIGSPTGKRAARPFARPAAAAQALPPAPERLRIAPAGDTWASADEDTDETVPPLDDLLATRLGESGGDGLWIPTIPGLAPSSARATPEEKMARVPGLVLDTFGVDLDHPDFAFETLVQGHRVGLRFHQDEERIVLELGARWLPADALETLEAFAAEAGADALWIAPAFDNPGWREAGFWARTEPRGLERPVDATLVDLGRFLQGLLASKPIAPLEWRRTAEGVALDSRQLHCLLRREPLGHRLLEVGVTEPSEAVLRALGSLTGHAMRFDVHFSFPDHTLPLPFVDAALKRLDALGLGTAAARDVRPNAAALVWQLAEGPLELSLTVEEQGTVVLDVGGLLPANLGHRRALDQVARRLGVRALGIQGTSLEDYPAWAAAGFKTSIPDRIGVLRRPVDNELSHLAELLETRLNQRWDGPYAAEPGPEGLALTGPRLSGVLERTGPGKFRFRPSVFPTPAPLLLHFQQIVFELGGRSWEYAPSDSLIVSSLNASHPEPTRVPRQVGGLSLGDLVVHGRLSAPALAQLSADVARFDAMGGERTAEAFRRAYVAPNLGETVWSSGERTCTHGRATPMGMLLREESILDDSLAPIHEAFHLIDPEGARARRPGSPLGKTGHRRLRRAGYPSRTFAAEDWCRTGAPLVRHFTEILAEPERELYAHEQGEQCRFLLEEVYEVKLPRTSPGNAELRTLLSRAFPHV